jgi:hypothetical protein
MPIWKRLLHEPLVHFLVLGALIFAGYALVNRGQSRNPATIVVTQGRIDTLIATFTKSWQRPPTKDELDALIADYVRDEVSAREATAMGLDQDDPVIRRRLRQKLDFVSDDQAAPREPTESELAAYLAAHADNFRAETRFTFKQVFLDPGKRGDRIGEDATRLLATLASQGANADVTKLGDPFLLDGAFASVTGSDVAMRFGGEFAQLLDKLPDGSWQGPIRSSYGSHLVFIERREAGDVPTLELAREAVRREWQNAERASAQEAFYQKLLARYTVVIEPAAK